MPNSAPKTSYPKDKINILFLENISDAAAEKLERHGYARIKRVKAALPEDELIKQIKDVHILGIRSKTQITRRVLQAAPRLQAIGAFCIGVNQIDLEAANEHGVAIFNAPYSNTRSVAELVIGASIMLMRQIPAKNKAAHEGIWHKDAAGSYELRGKTMGIIGYGNIGSQVSVLCEAMGLKILFYDTEAKLPLGNATACKSLKELLQQSDIVSIHIPELPGTENIINKSNLKHFKPGALFINFARGQMVDLAALADALKAGKLRGAAIDVFPVEPEKNGDRFQSPLQGLDNVLLTPHIGGSTVEAQWNIGEDVTTKLLNFLEKGITTGSHTVPAIGLPPVQNTHRILHIHHNRPGVLGAINSRLSEAGINIISQHLKTNEQIGYVVLDVDKQLSKKAQSLLNEVPETIKTRMLY